MNIKTKSPIVGKEAGHISQVEYVYVIHEELCPSVITKTMYGCECNPIFTTVSKREYLRLQGKKMLLSRRAKKLTTNLIKELQK
jgi:hypothetical protein